ncbi:MAG: DNA polymerase III subunit delta [Chloroflexota bacterium]
MPLTLFFGDNALEMTEATARERATFEPADVLTFDGSVAPVPAIVEACLTAGLFSPRRLVIVRNLHTSKALAKEEAGDSVLRLLTSLAPTTTLLLVSEVSDGKTNLEQAVRDANGTVRSFETPRKQQLSPWIETRTRRYHVSIDRDAAELLAESIGGNPVMLDSELQKLATYAGEGGSITREMVDALVGVVTLETIFALIDAIASGNRRVAFTLLHAQLDRGSGSSTDVALYVIRMMARQLRILLRIRLGQDAGETPAKVVSRLKIPSYLSDRYIRQARRLSQARLRSGFEQLAALDFALKSGKTTAETGLDLLVDALCS